MYCVDILDALTKDFFARKGNPIDETIELTEVQVTVDRPGYDPVSSTLWRQREEYCARLIQAAWRKHKIVRDNPPSASAAAIPGPSSTVVQIEEEDEEAVRAEEEADAVIVAASQGPKVTFAPGSGMTSSVSSPTTENA